MTWGGSPLPSWMGYSGTTYTYSGTAPEVGVVTTYILTIYAFDTWGAKTFTTVTLIINPNKDPVDDNTEWDKEYTIYSESYFEIQLPKDAMMDPEGKWIIYTHGMSTEEGVSYEIPEWATWHTYNRTLNGIPPWANSTNGTYTFVLVGNDGVGGSYEVEYKVYIKNLNWLITGMVLMGLMAFAAIIGTIIFVVHGCSIHLSNAELT